MSVSKLQLHVRLQFGLYAGFNSDFGLYSTRSIADPVHEYASDFILHDYLSKQPSTIGAEMGMQWQAVFPSLVELD